MRIIILALEKLFRHAPRITFRASRGLLSHGTAQFGIKALQRFSLRYQELSREEQAAVNEVVQYVVRFADSYIQHHDENHQYRIQADSLEEMLMSHAGEIMAAAQNAFNSRLRSQVYDSVAGRPSRTSMFMKEDFLKQFIVATIDEVCEGINAENQNARRY